MRKAASIARGRQLSIDEARGEERVDDQVEVDEPEPERHGQHQGEDPANRRVSPVDEHAQLAVEAAQPGQREQDLDERAEHDRARVDVEGVALRVGHRYADDDPDDDHEVPGDRAQRGHREVLVAVQDPDDHPGEPEQDHRREEEARQGNEEVLLRSLVAEGAHDPWREQDEERRQPAEAEEEEVEDARRDAPRPDTVAPLEQLAEDRDEGRGERLVCDERADQVRNLEGNREDVDVARDSEVPPDDDLPEEPEDPRPCCRQREDGGRAGEATPVSRLLRDFGSRHEVRV